MVDRVKKLADELQSKGQKITKQRLAILRVLEQAKTSVTAEEIFLRVREGADNTSLATIYRNLKILSDSGIVEKQGFLNDKAQFGLKKAVHSHNLVCLGCHKVIQINRCPLEHCETIGAKEGFTIIDHRMEFYGYCNNCRKR